MKKVHRCETSTKKMFRVLRKLFEDSNINRALSLRNQLSNLKMSRSKSVGSYFMRISELKNQLSTIGDPLNDKELVMNALNGLPPSWESFIQSLRGKPKLPKFDRIWAVCMQEETRLVARGRLHGTQHKENQGLTSHAKKGKGKGRKFHDKKDISGRSSPIPKQKKKKDL